jgi:hypothetical protein
MTNVHRFSAPLLAAAALFLLPRPAAPQQSDADWLDDCERHWNDDQEAHCEVRDVAVATTGSLGLVSQNGVVEIRGAEGSAVRLRARIRAWGDTQDDARAVARDVRIAVSGGTVRADGPNTGRGEGWNVDFVGTVPRRYDLDLETQNGPLSVRDVTGRIEVESQNGPVDLRGVGGAVRARASNGPLTLEVTDTRVGEAGIVVETSNGPLTVTLPESIDARLIAGSVNGPISSEFDVPIRRPERWSVSGDIDAQLGAGGGTIRARTSNGPLSIHSDG